MLWPLFNLLPEVKGDRPCLYLQIAQVRINHECSQENNNM